MQNKRLQARGEPRSHRSVLGVG